MASRATLKAETLVALGADRLARLILDEAARNAPFKRLAAAAVAAAKGPDAVAAIVDRRLATLERARGFVDYDHRKAFLADLKSILAVITEELGSADPVAAADRLLRFLDGAQDVLGRIDDSSGSIQSFYDEAAGGLAALIERTGGERQALVGRLIRSMLKEEGDIVALAVAELVPSLEPKERAQIDEACREAMPLSDEQRDWALAFQRRRLMQIRKAVADAADDVDAFIALEATQPEVQRDRVGIAQRLMKAGRLAEALSQVRKPRERILKIVSREDLADKDFAFDHFEYERLDLELAILDAMGDRETSQALRLQAFRDRLDADKLRDYLAKLPDFEDDEALDAAFAHVAAHPRHHTALGFFLRWPRHDLAAQLVLDRADQWQGRAYEILAPAAEVLEERHPAAATVLYHALIDDVLARGRSQAYEHAARYLLRLDALATKAAGELLERHETYRAALKTSHGRKQGFWILLPSP